MRASLAAALAIIASLLLAFADASAQQTTRVLFIGNSYTYFHNLPGILAKLAAYRHQTVETRMVAPGGWRLKDHWAKGEALPALKERRWDYVMLQDQSTLGVNYYVEGKPRVASDEVFRPYAEKWAAEVRKAGASPVFYLTWARKASPEDQAALNYAYIRAAKAGGARVAPVGIAWATVRREQPSIDLFFEDGSHPSAAGSYLAACTLYAALFNRSPVDLPARITGVQVNQEGEMPEPNKTAVLVDLPIEVAHVLQNAAWLAWKETSRPGFFNVSPVTPPRVASVPAGMRLARDDLAGAWKGTFHLFPTYPTDIVLRLDHDSGGWKGRVDLKYNTTDAVDQSFDLVDLRVTEREITFTISKAWQGLMMRFRGVSERPGVLAGTIDATLPNADTPVRLLASWELRKQ